MNIRSLIDVSNYDISELKDLAPDNKHVHKIEVHNGESYKDAASFTIDEIINLKYNLYKIADGICEYLAERERVS